MSTTIPLYFAINSDNPQHFGDKGGGYLGWGNRGNGKITFTRYIKLFNTISLTVYDPIFT